MLYLRFIMLCCLLPLTVEAYRNEKSFMGSKVCRSQVGMSLTHREVPKTNGHSVNTPPSKTPKLHFSPRLGRPLNLRPQGPLRYVASKIMHHWHLV